MGKRGSIVVLSSSPSSSEEDARRSSASRRRARATSSGSFSSVSKKPRRRSATRNPISKRDSRKVYIADLDMHIQSVIIQFLCFMYISKLDCNFPWIFYNSDYRVIFKYITGTRLILDLWIAVSVVLLCMSLLKSPHSLILYEKLKTNI
jgi:hypothetical protein